MGKKFFVPDREKCNELAQKIFMEMSGVGREGRKYEKMREGAAKMRETIEKRLSLRSVYAYFDDVKLQGNEAYLGDVAFSCPAFGQIDADSIRGAYVYAASAGDFGYSEEQMMDQLYADIWGSAFTDALRILMKEHFEKEHQLSDSFGPGFYGMDVGEMEKVGRILDFASIGIELRNSCIMVPLKACAGLLFAVEDTYTPLKRECMDCRGTHASCRLCQVYGGR